MSYKTMNELFPDQGHDRATQRRGFMRWEQTA